MDVTLGAGGHAKKLAEALKGQGRLVGMDRDAEALEQSKQELASFEDLVMIIHEDYRNIARVFKEKGLAADGILADLGVSSMQLDNPSRGFSFKGTGPLDMRMDTRQALTAQTIVNHYERNELEQILWAFGEERYSRRIVKAILAARNRFPIRTTGELAELIEDTVPSRYRFGRIHPATRTFQALRIAVNHELEALDSFLMQVVDCLKPGGRLAIISFHSLEDRRVKRAFRQFADEKKGAVLTRKPVVPCEEEWRTNPRARSSKLRVFEKAS